MILLDGMARSGTSLLGRLMEIILKPHGYAYYYEPFKHPTPAGLYDGWEAMIGRVILPGTEDSELADYLEKMRSSAPGGKVFWKEIRLALKQDWLLKRFPKLRIVHITRDILGVWSSHRRKAAPEWMENHRGLWLEALEEWGKQLPALKSKKIAHLDWFDRLAAMDDVEKYALIWSLNESFVWGLKHKRLLCVEYEDLCLYPLDILRKIAEFLRVPFGEQLQRESLAHLKESAEWKESRDPSGPGSGFSADAMPEIWKQRLQGNEIHSILMVAGGVREFLGYPAARL